MTKLRTPINALSCLTLIFLLIDCSSNSTAPDPTKPPGPGQIGAACSDNSQCDDGPCLTDVSFPAGYCFADCKDSSKCPEGASCEDYLGYRWCLDRCDDDQQCRERYVCDYGVCRPKCTRNQACHGSDVCRSGRCKPPCKADGECGGNNRCQDGKCLPPCKADSQCLPGFRCDAAKGKCVAKPGKAMGLGCSQSSECATGYCLPTRRICSIKCKGTSVCPKGYVCGLERVDLDGNGSFEAAEADCVPVAGKGVAGAQCKKDGDCASKHCFYGFCMEGCNKDVDCGGAQCVQVSLLLGGGIPRYLGCLPRAGVSHDFDLGTHAPGDTVGLSVPPNAGSVILTTKVDRADAVGLVAEAKDPKGRVLSKPADQCQFYGQPIRYMYDTQVSNLYIPNTPSVKLIPGIYAFQLTASKPGVKIKASVSMKLGKAQKGTININWFFLNLSRTCIGGGTLNAASAPSHPWLKKIVASMQQIMDKAKLKVGKQRYYDLKNPALDVLDLNEAGPSPELQKLFSASANAQGDVINVFLVRGIKSGMRGGIVLGISGGIPGPPAIHGTAHSGVALSVQTACFEKYGYNPGHTLAHEIGHYLGLFHNQENYTNPGYDAEKKKVVCPCPCADNMTCELDIGARWCRGLDPIPDTSIRNDNLMYFAAENTQKFSGNKISAGQIRVILDNPIIGF